MIKCESCKDERAQALKEKDGEIDIEETHPINEAEYECLVCNALICESCKDFHNDECERYTKINQ